MYSTPTSRRNARLTGAGRVLFVTASILLVACVMLLGKAVGQEQHDDRLRRNVCLILFAGLGLAFAFLKSETAERSRVDRIIACCATLLPVYALLQLLPLPEPLVSFLSPARGELLRALRPIAGSVPAFASLSVVPGITFTHFVLITGYAVVFFSIRSLVRAAPGSSWAVAIPVLLAALLQTAAAFLQASAGAPVQGTYAVRNHFAGLLIMAVPFSIAWLLSIVNGARGGGARDVPVGLRFSAALLITAVLLSGIAFSLSRGGFAAMLASASVLAVLAFPSGLSVRSRLLACAAAALSLVVALFFLTPMALVQRLAEHSSSGRISIWRNTLDLIEAYPIVGCGLGGYESAMLHFKNTVLLNDLDYAHNDYLQYLGELGIVGFVIAAGLFGTLLVRVIKASGTRSQARWVGVGCAGALSAMLAHSAFDFNLYVPANAIVFAWIAGISAALPLPRQRDDDALPIEVLSAEPNQSTPSL